MARRVPFLSDKAERASGSLLPWVIAVMVYLSGLALAGAVSVNDAVTNWTGDLGRQLTVQIVASNAEVQEDQARAAEALLASTPGVEAVRRLADSELARLLEPWLGTGNVDADLPLPTLLDVTLIEGRTLNTRALASQLQNVAPDARLDTNEQWLGRLHAVASMVQGTALVILVLITLATVAIVIFGTHAGLAAHRQTIETLHIIGARDSLIAREFQDRFLKLGIWGGLIGIIFAGLTLYLGGRLMDSLGGGIMERVTLNMTDAILLVLLPLVAGILSMLTARITVLRALAKMV